VRVDTTVLNLSTGTQMNNRLALLALFAATGLAACQPNVVSVPAPVATPGPAGPQGATGNQGNDGSTGAKGNQGNQGNDGTTGATGATGSQGNDGMKGDKGKTGDDTTLIVIPRPASSPSN
jgi:hypothetical protein